MIEIDSLRSDLSTVFVNNAQAPTSKCNSKQLTELIEQEIDSFSV